jgi:hypothetical protein
MKLVKESLNEFQQGGDPYKIMGLGKLRPGDTIEFLDYIGAAWKQNSEFWWERYSKMHPTATYSDHDISHDEFILKGSIGVVKIITNAYITQHYDASNAWEIKQLNKESTGDVWTWWFDKEWFSENPDLWRRVNVNESINEFKQGGNPYDTMDIGSRRAVKNGVWVRCLTDIICSTSGWNWSPNDDWEIRNPDLTRDWGSLMKSGDEFEVEIGSEDDIILWNSRGDKDCYFDREEISKYFKII